jgi:hypothetical protein
VARQPAAASSYDVALCILFYKKGATAVLYVRIIVGIAFLLMAAFGPGIGVRPAARRRTGPDAIGQGNAAHDSTGSVSGVSHSASGVSHKDQRVAAVLILRILAAMLGLWLLFFSIVQLLHGHGHLPH